MEHFALINTVLIGGVVIAGLIISIAFKWGIHGCEDRLARIEKHLGQGKESGTVDKERPT